MENESQKSVKRTTDRGDTGVAGKVMRRITGWSLLAAAAGTFYDAFMCDGCAQGSIGLIPLYLGFPIGAVGLVLVFWRVVGWVPALLAASGLAGILFFMFSYPNGAEGWIGAILVGIAHLFLPLSGRLASVLWVAVGILGFPEFGEPSWGPIAAFTVFGAATAASGAFVLFDLGSAVPVQVSEGSTND